jgi:hypothetical protein
MSTKTFYERLTKAEAMENPREYAWNCVLHYIQFSQEELVQLKPYLHIPKLIRYQTSLTREFLETHFAEEIDACMEVDWLDVEKYVPK